MIDLKANYLGLELKNPIIVGSCGLTNSVDSIVELAENGAGAVVLKSLFEEQINIQIAKDLGEQPQSNKHAESGDYVAYFEKMHLIEKYLKLISDVKSKVDIPVIASINCHSDSEWVNFAAQIEKAGADALELNVFKLQTDPNYSGDTLEQIHLDIVKSVTEQISIPLSLKIGNCFDNTAKIIRSLSRTNIKGLVLFNRFYSPDIDIDKIESSVANPMSTPDEIHTTLRWIAIASDFAECDLCASTGIHDGTGVVKQLLAGSTAVQMVSAIYEHKPVRIKESLDFLTEWMQKNEFQTIDSFRGKLSRKHIKNVYERVQFLKYEDNSQ